MDPPLPSTLLITPEPPGDAQFDVFLDRLRHAVSSGVALVQLRAKTLDASAYRGSPSRHARCVIDTARALF